MTKPIKRHQAMVSFSKDHHFGLLLVWKIRQGLQKSVAPERIAGYVRFFFEADLAKHFSDEEQLLFSRLAETDVLRVQAEKEHATIYQLVKDIGQQPTDASLLTQLADALEQHIRFEERSLFNHLQQHIPEAELQAIENRISNNSQEIEAQWKDSFWS